MDSVSYDVEFDNNGNVGLLPGQRVKMLAGAGCSEVFGPLEGREGFVVERLPDHAQPKKGNTPGPDRLFSVKLVPTAAETTARAELLASEAAAFETLVAEAREAFERARTEGAAVTGTTPAEGEVSEVSESEFVPPPRPSPTPAPGLVAVARKSLGVAPTVLTGVPSKLVRHSTWILCTGLWGC